MHITTFVSHLFHICNEAYFKPISKAQYSSHVVCVTILGVLFATVVTVTYILLNNLIICIFSHLYILFPYVNLHDNILIWVWHHRSFVLPAQGQLHFLTLHIFWLLIMHHIRNILNWPDTDSGFESFIFNLLFKLGLLTQIEMMSTLNVFVSKLII